MDTKESVTGGPAEPRRPGPAAPLAGGRLADDNRAELERRLGHATDLYLGLYTNPPEDIAAGWAERL